MIEVLGYGSCSLHAAYTGPRPAKPGELAVTDVDHENGVITIGRWESPDGEKKA